MVYYRRTLLQAWLLQQAPLEGLLGLRRVLGPFL